jgi:hypothetical protein
LQRDNAKPNSGYCFGSSQVYEGEKNMSENKIFTAMIAVMKDCEAVSKDRTNIKQNYRYRGIDDVYNMLHPIMAKHGVFMTTEVLSVTETEKRSSSGGVLFYRQASVKFTFHAEDGSSVFSIVNGEAMDSGDKATNKAMAVAHKYCLFQAFCLPTEDDNDPDANTHNVVPSPQKQTPPPQKPVVQPPSPKAATPPPAPPAQPDIQDKPHYTKYISYKSQADRAGGKTLNLFIQIMNDYLNKENITTEELREADYEAINKIITNYKAK